MYKTIVDSVNGTKVLAGGKWLTCIGNRPVKVGDTIWTDGRCVYGNVQEAHSTAIFTSTDKNFIPIQLGDKLFNFINGQLFEVSSMPNGSILNDRKSNVYGLKVAAANCFDNGNIFSIDSTNSRYEIRENSNAIDVPTLEVSLELNGKSFHRIQLHDSVKNIIEQTLSEVENLPHANGFDDGVILEEIRQGQLYRETISTHYHKNIQCYVIWAFISDDKNWAFFYYVFVRFDKNRTFSAGYNETSPLAVTTDGYAYNCYCFYFDSSGKSALIYRYHLLAKFQRHDLFPPTDDVNDFEYKQDVDSPDLHDFHFPIQDNYFFKMQIISPDENLSVYEKFLYTTLPLVTYEVYSPNDNLLFTCNDFIGVYFSICKIAGNDFLVGINSAVTNPLVPSNKGLFICQNASLHNIAENLKNSNCRNYYLRPMKFSSYWWNKIQQL